MKSLIISLHEHLWFVLQRKTRKVHPKNMGEDEIRGLLLGEANRLDVVDGMEAMTKVTGRFLCGSKEERTKSQHDLTTLAGMVEYKFKKRE